MVRSIVCLMLLSLVMFGCESAYDSDVTPDTVPPVDTLPRAETHEGVDVDVDPNGGGVDVDVNGPRGGNIDVDVP